MTKTLRGELIRAFVVIGILLLVLSFTVNFGMINTKNNINNLKKFVINQVLYISNSQVQLAQYSSVLLNDVNNYTVGQNTKSALKTDLNNITQNINSIGNALEDFKGTSLYKQLKADVDGINDSIKNISTAIDSLNDTYNLDQDSDKTLKISYYATQIQNNMTDFSNKYSQGFLPMFNDMIAQNDRTFKVSVIISVICIVVIIIYSLITVRKLRKLSRIINSEVSKSMEHSEKVLDSSIELRKMAEENTGNIKMSRDGIEQLTESINTIAENANEVALSITNVSEANEELSRSSENLLNDMNKAIEKIREIEDNVKNQGDVVRNLINTLNQSLKNSKVNSNELKELDKKMGGIKEILSAISEIADQTNLLSLNAAIEAARAGEYGKGFAVVAEEIRKLAKQSTDSVVKIGEIIENITSYTGVTIDSVINDIDNSTKAASEVNKVLDIFNDVKKGFDEISMVISNISDVTTETAAGSDKTLQAVKSVMGASQNISAQVEELLASSEQLMEIINKVDENNTKNLDYVNNQVTFTEEQKANMESITNAVKKL
ncbi:methyl-accepting chemotaxis protein [Thermoanaerobacterium thermosaccharolyticum]|jgi:methyl-accepting chemotaxis protein|uniref:Methyl-accepting chemotaxis protein n=2 Tax=Thermoanaerobacterium thermosaccharolyticum TaxID=1517 RepID=A0A223HWT8_THETR|nr:methyl-accepting chemotaxis protein [Thermoanaerobacterium thermosaccharolyticum]AGB19883.1 methyl-accepting chemotaxis protein [Thermoanaerobacterium thermosaccharolyticum M0795]AST56902.1 methyl-accepting chemotaxis protein [Thermoanaerobacterium thermosaccharolyticum]PHO07938.1 chemotaxis protein [Thermoanaerobacterium thermosaccharolyticum]TCW42249.1 methyl-accepting chemotaxis protein [Thermohydrogenium kirishiense]